MTKAHEFQAYQDTWMKYTRRLQGPFYYYDLDALSDHLTSMREALIAHKLDQVKLWYACKANPLSSVLKIFRNLGFGIDIASLGELEQALGVGIKPHELIATGPAKSKAYLRSLLQEELQTIVLESLNQAYWLNELAVDMDLHPKVLLRMQLSFDGGQSVLGGNAVTAFGLEPQDWIEADWSRLQQLDVLGAHAFQWGNLLDTQRLREIWWQTTLEARTLFETLGLPLRVLDLGGGLGVPYKSGTEALNFSEVAKLLGELIQSFSLKEVWMELGRYSVADCGFYLAPIVDRKRTRGVDLLVLEGGINHLARPALTGESFPAHPFRVNGTLSHDTQAFQVHGPLCTALDLLGTFELPEDLGPGDWLVFSKTGAYGFTEAMPFFLCHNLPAEVIQYRGDIVTPRPSKTSTDWMV
jgi:diaminopimelate decarboxylase